MDVTSDGLHPHGDQCHPQSALLLRICAACVKSLPIVGAAVSVMLPGGHRGVAAATDDTARQIEDVQFTVGQGPGVDAFREGRAELVADLGTEDRWPAFSFAVEALGVAALFAFPLHLGAATLGCLTLYAVEPSELHGPDLARAVRLADAATLALLDLLGGLDGRVGDGVDSALVGEPGAEFFRSEVYQAAGMVMGQLGIGIEAAMVRLRAYAFSTGRSTSDVARDIVARTLRLEADNE